MASLTRLSNLTNIQLLTNLSVGTFNDIFLIIGNDEINIKNLFLDYPTFNNFLSQYNSFLSQYASDKKYMLHLHNLQDIQINGGTLTDDYIINYTSQGKADKYHTHQISDVINLATILNSKRNLNDFNFRNITDNLYINDLVYKSNNTDKTLSTELNNRRLITDFNFKNTTNSIDCNDLNYLDENNTVRSLREVLQKLVDAIFGQNDILSDFEKIYDLVNTFSGGSSPSNPLNPYNWNNYFTNTTVKNGLVFGLIGFLQGQIIAATAPLTDTSDLKYFIPSNDTYTRKGISSSVNSLYKSNNSNFLSIYPVYNRLCFKDNGVKSLDNDFSATSPYSFLTNLKPILNYKQALILDSIPLEFHNGAAIKLNQDEIFKIKSGNYYWNDTTTSYLSIPQNNQEIDLLSLSSTNTTFYSRLYDKSGKKYVLEDEVVTSQPSKYLTINYFDSSDIYSDYSKKYTTINNNLQETYPTNYFTHQINKYNATFQNDNYNYETISKTTHIGVKEAFFNDENNIYNTKKINNVNNYYEDTFIDNSKKYITNNHNIFEENNTYNETIQKTYKQFSLSNEDNSCIYNKKKIFYNFNEDNLNYYTLKNYYTAIKEASFNEENNIYNTRKITSLNNLNEENYIYNLKKQYLTLSYDDNNYYNNITKKNYYNNFEDNTNYVNNNSKSYHNLTYNDTSLINTKKYISNNFNEDNNTLITNKKISNYQINNNEENLYSYYTYHNNSVHTNNLYLDNIDNLYNATTYNSFLFNETNLSNYNNSFTKNLILNDNSDNSINQINTKKYETLINNTNETINTNNNYNQVFNNNSNEIITTNKSYNTLIQEGDNSFTSNKYINSKSYNHTVNEVYEYDNTFSLIPIKSQIATINNSINSINNDINTINSSITSINNNINTNASNINSINSSISALTNGYNTLNNQIIYINENVIPAIQSLISNNYNYLQSLITDNTTKINNILTAIANLNNYFSSKIVKYNIFKLQDNSDPIYGTGIAPGYVVLYNNIENVISWKYYNNSLTDNTNIITTTDSNTMQIQISDIGFYEFKLTIDILQYTANSSKSNGTIEIRLYVNNTYTDFYNYYLNSSDYSAHDFSFFYKKTTNSNDTIKFKIYHQLTSSNDLFNNAILLQASTTKLYIVKNPDNS